LTTAISLSSAHSVSPIDRACAQAALGKKFGLPESTLIAFQRKRVYSRVERSAGANSGKSAGARVSPPERTNFDAAGAPHAIFKAAGNGASFQRDFQFRQRSLAYS